MTKCTLLGELLHDCAEKYSDRPFLTMAPSGQSYSYAQFESLTNRISHGLTARFDPLPEYVAIMLENCPNYLATTYALKKTGPIEVSINRTFRGPALARTINLTQTPVLFTSAAHFEAIAMIAEELDYLTTLIVTDGKAKAQQLRRNYVYIWHNRCIKRLCTISPLCHSNCTKFDCAI